VLNSEPGAQPAETCYHLVGDEQDAVAQFVIDSKRPMIAGQRSER
jgi:hypothetical protein